MVLKEQIIHAKVFSPNGTLIFQTEFIGSVETADGLMVFKMADGWTLLAPAAWCLINTTPVEKVDK